MPTINELLAINACITTGGDVEECRKATEFTKEAKDLQEWDELALTLNNIHVRSGTSRLSLERK